jgi:signal transduction histidine kinase
MRQQGDDEEPGDEDAAAHERLRDAIDARAEALEQARSAQAAAERANELKDRFLSTVSHELRTPLNAILGWVQLMRGGQLTPEQIGRGLQAIERNARTQERLITDLLDVSHMRHGRLVIARERVDVCQVVERVVDLMRPLAEARRVALVWRRRLAGPLAVLGDAGRLQQVLTNLISNAVKFTPAGGQVTVSAGTEGKATVLRVADTGEGIDAETLPNLFDRFFQGETSAKRVGLGLGLVTVKELVELHGGTVVATSRGHGLGSTFTVSLPLA